MSKNTKIDFNSIVNDILDNEEFKKLNKEIHHGISRYDHSVKVAKKTYNFCKNFKKLDYIGATRAALLHDFFTNKEMKDLSAIKRYKTHPSLAVENSSKYYILSDMEKDAILSHMFPWNLKAPKYKESWVVTLADKIVSIKEGYSTKFVLPISIFILFLFNVIMVSR